VCVCVCVCVCVGFVMCGCFGNMYTVFLISNFRRVLYVLCFLLGNSPASEFINLLAYEDGTDKLFRNVGIKNSDAGELPRRKHTCILYSD
jgi:hypothetical protein